METPASSRIRYVLFGAVLLLHVVVLWLVANLVIFPAPTSAVDEEPMQRIALPTKPVEPPPLAAASANFNPLPAAPAPPTVITTSAPAITFTMPPVGLPNGNDLIPKLDHRAGGSGDTGHAQGNGTGSGQDLLGGGIDRAAHIAVVLDTSGSMKTFDEITQNYFQSNYSNAKFYRAPNAIGGFMPPAPTDSPPDWQESQNYGSTDFYSFMYGALVAKPEVVVVITDFEDGYLPEATTTLVNTLRQHHIKLVLISREMAAYPGLPEYSLESGGTYRLVTINEQSKTMADIQSDPQLPPSPPLSTIFATMDEAHFRHQWFPRLQSTSSPYDRGGGAIIYGFISKQMSALKNPNSEVRKIIYDLNEQDHRDAITQQVLLFCVQFPGQEDISTTDGITGAVSYALSMPNLVQMDSLTQSITAEILRHTANDASASHVALQIIRVALQTHDQSLMKMLPALLRATAECRDTIPTQTRTNAEEIVLSCNEFIDEGTPPSHALTTAILQTVALTQNSKDSQVQEAGWYLKFTLGDQTGFAECLSELAKAKDSPLAERVIKHVVFPAAVNDNKVNYLMEHQASAVYDPSSSNWKFSEPSASPSSLVPSPSASEDKK